MGGVAVRVIGTECAAQDWWLVRSEHFSVTENVHVTVSDIHGSQ